MPGNPVIEMEGKTFGLLTVLCREGTYRKFAAWRCRCTCGVEVVVSGQHLRRGERKACARNGHFWASQSRPGLIKQYPSEYKSWCQMRGRCRNKRHHKYKDYGKRGIKVCERWNSFQNFIADMKRKPTPKHTIEREDVNGNYEPDNCRWATPAEQRRNQRRSVYVEVEGVKVLLMDVADKLGLNRQMVYGRLKNGWSLESALSIPVRRHKAQRKKKKKRSPT
jgi:hypothetical protein